MNCTLCLLNPADDTQNFDSVDQENMMDLVIQILNICKISTNLDQSSWHSLLCIECSKQTLQFQEFCKSIIESRKKYENIKEVQDTISQTPPLSFDNENQIQIEIISAEVIGYDDTCQTIEVVTGYEEVCTLPSEELRESIDASYVESIVDASDVKETDMDHLSVRQVLKKKRIIKEKRIENDEERIRNFYELCCGECSEIFLTLIDYINHLTKIHFIQKPFIHCPICNKKISKRFFALEHIEYHTNPNAFKCESCDKHFSSKYVLDLHMSQNHNVGKKKYTCDLCSKTFAYSILLTKHMKQKHDLSKKESITYRCNDCDKDFTSKQGIEYHMKTTHTKTTVKNFCCETCGKDYTSQTNLRDHIQLNHSPSIAEELKVQCKICQKWLKHNRILIAHMKQQHSDVTYKCNICGKNMKNREAITLHIKRVHDREIKHHCRFCEANFFSKKHWKEHESTHTGTYLFECKTCGKGFHSSSNYYRHKKNVHPTEAVKEDD